MKMKICDNWLLGKTWDPEGKAASAMRLP
jgi:hypothetical protein